MTILSFSAIPFVVGRSGRRAHRGRVRRRAAEERGAVAAERQHGVQGLAGAARIAARAGQPAARRRHVGVRCAAGEPARLPGGRQQVGVVVRAVPVRVPGVPARVGRASASRSRSWASTARTEPGGDDVPAQVPGDVPELRRSATRRSRARSTPRPTIRRRSSTTATGKIVFDHAGTVRERQRARKGHPPIRARMTVTVIYEVRRVRDSTR